VIISGQPPLYMPNDQTTQSSFGSRLDEVLRLCRAMHDQQDAAAILRLVAKEAAGILRADKASIFVYDRERCELISQVTLDGQDIRFDARLGVAGAAVLTKQLVNVANAQEDARFHAAVDSQTNYRTRNTLAIPILDGTGECLGVLQVLNKHAGAFTGADEDIANILATQAAIALTSIRETSTNQPPRNDSAPDPTSQISTRDIIGTSTRIQDIIRLIDQLRDTSVDVLVTGESGTGKEMVARALHSNSPRAARPFIALNCGALPDNLVESELFGIEKGVATGVDRRIGKFEEAHQGTIFLDEVGDLNQTAQVKLLRVLQERVIERVGGRTLIPTDVRVIAATNADLLRAIERGTFRADLYYRLKVVTIQMPPLREIPEDIPALVSSFLRKNAAEFGKNEKILTDSAMRRLLDYRWPGNVRELEHEIKRLMASTRKTVVSEADLAESIRGTTVAQVPKDGHSSLKAAVEQLEQRMIREALRACKDNQMRAAKALGISRQGLIKKMKRYSM